MDETDERRTCGQCANFLGGGDWGTSCAAYYMRCVAEDSDAGRCGRFKPKQKEVPRACR